MVLPAWASPPPLPAEAPWTGWLLRNRKRVLISCGSLAVVGTLGAILSQAVPSAATERQTLTELAAQQATVDTAMHDFLTAPTIAGSSTDAIRGESDRRLAEYQRALALVQREESSLSQARSTLAMLGPLSLGNGSGSQLDRRASIALSGLTKSDEVLSAAVDQEIVERGVFETALREQQMLDAIKQQQYMAADRIDADADHWLLSAEWRENYSDLPPQMRSLVGIMRLIIDKTDLIAILTFQNEQEELPNAQAELAQDFQIYRQATEASAAEDFAWDVAQYKPKVDGYEMAIRQLQSLPSS